MQGQSTLLLQYPRHLLPVFVTLPYHLTQNLLLYQPNSTQNYDDLSMSSWASRARCKYIGASSSRCGALVSLANAINFPRGRSIPTYCAFHQQLVLSTKSYTIRKQTGTRMIHFKRSRCCSRLSSTVFDYISGFVSLALEPRTQIALRHTMAQRLLRSDHAGYMYALELAGRCCGERYSPCDCRQFPSRPGQPGPHPNQSWAFR